MILQDLVLQSRKNQQMKFSGIDTIESCLNKDYFTQYPHLINYNFNSRGFRDQEWPIDLDTLQQSIWCIGDSFTTGIGQPFEHTWPQVLQNVSGTRTISISLDGASNQWIHRRALEIVEKVTPKNMVIMWSYFHRRELTNTDMSDENRRLYYVKTTQEEDAKNFFESIWPLTQITNVNIIHSLVPWAAAGQTDTAEKEHNKFYWTNDTTYSALVNLPNFIGEVTQIDKARDYHHFDIKTSQQFVNQVMPLLI